MSFKNILVVSVVIIFFSATTKAQGWRWGRSGSGVSNSWHVATDNRGNIYTGGGHGGAATFDTVSLPATTGVGAVWAKYNSAGHAIWVDGVIGLSSHLINISTDRMGNLIVFGTFGGGSVTIGSFTLSNAYASSSGRQYFVAKVDPSGTVLWAKNGGNVFQYTGGVTTDDSGNVYIAGIFHAATMAIDTFTLTNAGTPRADFYLAKYTSTGTLAWARSVGGAGDDVAQGLTVTPSGRFYISGKFGAPSITIGSFTLTNSTSSESAFIAEYTTGGFPVWAQAGTLSIGSMGTSLAHDSVGNIYMTGFFRDNTISFGSSSFSRTIPADIPPQYSAFLLKYSPANAVLWGRVVSSHLGPIKGYSVSFSSCGEVWMSGEATTQPFFGVGDTLVISPWYDPMFIAGYDVSGGIIGYEGLATGGGGGNGIACDGAGSVYVCSRMGGVPVTVGPDVLTPSTGSHFLAKYGTHTYYKTVARPTSYACSGDSTILTAPPGTYYLWENGSTTQSRTIGSPGTYSVTVTSCGDTAYQYTYNVLAHTQVGVISGPAKFCISHTATYTDTTSGGAWTSSSPAVATISSASGVATGVAAGTVTFTYTSPIGCFVTKQVTVEALPCHVETTEVTPSEQLAINPNPATDQLMINARQEFYSTYTITNNVGQVLLQQPVLAARTNVDIRSFAPGLYYVMLKGEMGSVVKKFVKL